MKNNKKFTGVTFSVQAFDNGRNWLQNYYCMVPAWVHGLDRWQLAAWAQRALPELIGCDRVNVRGFEIDPAPSKKVSTWASWTK